MRKLLLLLTILVCSTKLSAQQNYYVEPKLNIAAAGVAIFNPALEIGFAKYSAINLDYIGVYAQENYMGTGNAFLLNMVNFEYRAYMLNQDHKGFFAGANMGLGSYKMNKSVIPLLQNEDRDEIYNWGTSVTLGLTLGYKFLINERFGIELSATGGWQHTQHEIYEDSTGDCLVKMNASGEWTPIKAGVFFTYRF